MLRAPAPVHGCPDGRWAPPGRYAQVVRKEQAPVESGGRQAYDLAVNVSQRASAASRSPYAAYFFAQSLTIGIVNVLPL